FPVHIRQFLYPQPQFLFNSHIHYFLMYNAAGIVCEMARMVFQLLCPSTSSPAEDWATLASCALVCREWQVIASPFLYRNIVLNMSPGWQRLRALADSTSP